jgi:hypothetical protein
MSSRWLTAKATARANVSAGTARFIGLAESLSDIDEMPGFLLLHVRQRRGYAVQHAFDVHIAHMVPSVDLEPLEWRLRYQPRVIDHGIDPPACLYGCIDQSFDLLAVRYVRSYRECLAAATG